MNFKTTIGLILLIVTILGGGLAFAVKSGSAGACEVGTSTADWRMEVSGDKVSPSQIVATKCSRLTIVNNDDVTRHIAFGAHDKHVVYDGVEDKHLKKGESFTVTLDKTGEYHWHDHDDDTVQGFFTVTR